MPYPNVTCRHWKWTYMTQKTSNDCNAKWCTKVLQKSYSCVNTWKNLSHCKKNLSQVKKNLSQSTVYILQKHPHITKPTQTHTLQNPLIHTRAHTHTTKQYKTTTVQIKLIQPLTEMSTRNISRGVKVAGAYGWQPYHIHVPIVLKYGSLNLLEPSGPVQACNGIALPFTVR